MIVRVDDSEGGMMPVRVQGGGQGPPPPLEIEKQKKNRSSEQILSNFTYILLLFQSEI